MPEISRRLGSAAGKMIPPGQMQAMMGQMMDTMIGGMTVEDRIAFVNAMLPRCLGAIFTGLDAPAREQVAAAMTERMTDAARAAAAGGEQ